MFRSGNKYFFGSMKRAAEKKPIKYLPETEFRSHEALFFHSGKVSFQDQINKQKHQFFEAAERVKTGVK